MALLPKSTGDSFFFFFSRYEIKFKKEEHAHCHSYLPVLLEGQCTGSRTRLSWGDAFSGYTVIDKQSHLRAFLSLTSPVERRQQPYDKVIHSPLKCQT